MSDSSAPMEIERLPRGVPQRLYECWSLARASGTTQMDYGPTASIRQTRLRPRDAASPRTARWSCLGPTDCRESSRERSGRCRCSTSSALCAAPRQSCCPIPCRHCQHSAIDLLHLPRGAAGRSPQVLPTGRRIHRSRTPGATCTWPSTSPQYVKTYRATRLSSISGLPGQVRPPPERPGQPARRSSH